MGLQIAFDSTFQAELTPYFKKPDNGDSRKALAGLWVECFKDRFDWAVRIPSTSPMGSRLLRIGWNQKPDEFFVEPVPMPKVRKGIETRYRNGRWEKLLKKGWVAA